MKSRLSLAALLACVLSGPLQAGCYADYKAKQTAPLRLAYGVAELPEAGCASTEAAAAVLAPRLAAAGWTLLSILAIFGPEGLTERKESAGDHFLRY